MKEIINKNVRIGGHWYTVISKTNNGNYYKLTPVHKPKIVLDDGVETIFSHPHRVYYSCDMIEETWLGNNRVELEL